MPAKQSTCRPASTMTFRSTCNSRPSPTPQGPVTGRHLLLKSHCMTPGFVFHGSLRSSPLASARGRATPCLILFSAFCSRASFATYGPRCGKLATSPSCHGTPPCLIVLFFSTARRVGRSSCLTRHGWMTFHSSSRHLMLRHSSNGSLMGPLPWLTPAWSTRSCRISAEAKPRPSCICVLGRPAASGASSSRTRAVPCHCVAASGRKPNSELPRHISTLGDCFTTRDISSERSRPVRRRPGPPSTKIKRRFSHRLSRASSGQGNFVRQLGCHYALLWLGHVA